MGMLVTVGTDGFRDFVNLPDGRTFTLGSVSVLKFVTSLVSSGAIARKVLDTFLAKGEAKLSVDLAEMEVLLQPKRSRWAVHENRLIPMVSRPLPRGASTMNPFEFKLAALEALVTSLNNTASPAQVRTLQQLAHGLSVDPIAKEGAVDEDAKTELELYMDNEGRLSNQKEGILKNILRKMKSGKYDHNLSPKLWMYWVDEGAKMYAKEFGGEAKTLFPKPLREALAKDIADHEKGLIEEGNYGHIKVADEGEVMASSAVLSFKAAGAESKESEEKESRFEEGKSADPTENMSKEDADEWKKQNDEHKDKFKAAAEDKELKTVLTRLAVAKKAVAAMSESEAQHLVDASTKLHREASDLFDAQHRSKANYYDPVDPSLVDRLKDLYGKVLTGLKVLSRIDSKDAPQQLTKDLSTFGQMGLRLDTLSEAAGLAYTIDNKARLVLYKAKRAAQQVRFYTNWIESYKSTGSSPSMDDQWKWLREKSAADGLETEEVPGGGLDPAPPFGDAMVLEGLDEIMASARKAQAAYTSGKTGKVFFSLLGVLNGLGRVGTAFDLPDIGYLMRVRKSFQTLSSGRPTTNFSASEEDFKAASGDKISSEPLTVKLKGGKGEEVLAKMYKGEPDAVTYANRTQAYAAAAKQGDGWEVIQRGRPWYLRKDPEGGKSASEVPTSESTTEDSFKTATVNEALAASVLTKVEAALQAVETSSRTNTKVATMDLHIISSKLAEMLQVKALTDGDLQPQLLDLASKAEKIQAHFGAAKQVQGLTQDGKGSK
jgi:hypothetical protein